jgi:hypothetical protein
MKPCASLKHHAKFITVLLVAVVTVTLCVDSLPSGAAVSAPSATSGRSTHRENSAAGKVTPSGGLIAVGASRSECLTPDLAAGKYGLAYLQSLVASFDNETDSLTTCISSYLESPSWSTWQDPWITQAQYGYTSWVAQEPSVRQLIIAVNLIPLNLQDISNPSGWEQSCASGKYDGYAQSLGENLVSAGLENSVIRLGPEMNGVWEPDFIGTKLVQQKLWARCFANEVTSLRQAPGEHFIIDWNVNACKGNYPYSNYYPGNAYVDVVGLDLYDVACEIPTTRVTFLQLSHEQAGLSRFEAFAASKKKPMSLPEWGLSTVPSGDDPAYIDGIGTTVANGDFAFESYFEGSGPNVKALALGPDTPLSLAAYKEWFGLSPKS